MCSIHLRQSNKYKCTYFQWVWNWCALLATFLLNFSNFLFVVNLHRKIMSNPPSLTLNVCDYDCWSYRIYVYIQTATIEIVGIFGQNACVRFGKEGQKKTIILSWKILKSRSNGGAQYQLWGKYKYEEWMSKRAVFLSYLTYRKHRYTQWNHLMCYAYSKVNTKRASTIQPFSRLSKCSEFQCFERLDAYNFDG